MENKLVIGRIHTSSTYTKLEKNKVSRKLHIANIDGREKIAPSNRQLFGTRGSRIEADTYSYFPITTVIFNFLITGNELCLIIA